MMTNGPPISPLEVVAQLTKTTTPVRQGSDPEVAAARPAPNPKRVPLPYGGLALMYTRENVAHILRCSHGELGRLLRLAGPAGDRLCPLPIRVDGQVLWFADELLTAQASIERTLNRWRKR